MFESPVRCVYCHGRLVVDEGMFIEFLPDEDGFSDLEPLTSQITECCHGPELHRTPQAAYDHACGYHD